MGCYLVRIPQKKKVIEVRSIRNTNTERSHDRYEIEGREFIKADKEAARKGLQIIGIYHSHPDHPAIPSDFDTEHAWCGYSYLIAAVENGIKIEIRRNGRMIRMRVIYPNDL